jgi:hypothetical protein
MTHETKAGLVVSCSFLCLVGVVLVSKLREKSAATAGAEVAANETDPDVPAAPTPVGSKAAATPSVARNRPNQKGLNVTSSAIVPMRFDSPGDAKPLQAKNGAATDKKATKPADSSTFADLLGTTGGKAGTTPPNASPLNKAGAPGDTNPPKGFDFMSAPVATKTPTPAPPSAQVGGQAASSMDDLFKRITPSDAKDKKTEPAPAPKVEFPSTTATAGNAVKTNPNGIKESAPPPGFDMSFNSAPPRAAATGGKPADDANPITKNVTNPTDAALSKSKDGNKIVLPPPDSSWLQSSVNGNGGDSKSNTASTGATVTNTAVVQDSKQGRPSGDITAPLPAFPALSRNNTAPPAAAPAPSPDPFKLRMESGPAPAGAAAGGASKDNSPLAAPTNPPTAKADVPFRITPREPANGTANSGMPAPSSTFPAVNNPASQNIRLGNPATAEPAPNLVAQAPANIPTFPAPMNGAGARTGAAGGGALAALTPPTNVAPAPSGAPDVESYDEETYTWRPADSFRAISQGYYHSETYERALLLFNRNHPLATDAVRRDPPVVQAGQPIYIPPARILEKYYASAITEVAHLAPAAATETITPTARIAPQPVQEEKRYRVKNGGEMVLDIARRTLGNSDRWTEIYRLNPRFDPKDPLPAGSELRLPADARLDPQDAP